MRIGSFALAASLALAACKDKGEGATPSAPAPAPATAPAITPPIHVAPPAPASPAPSADPASNRAAAQAELDHLDAVIAQAKRAVDAAHSDAERVKARSLLAATQRRRDALAQRLAQPVPQ